MNPTATSTDALKPSHHISQRPPTNANDYDSMTIRVPVSALKLRNISRKISAKLKGTTMSSRAWGRSRYSN
jgi:hypothetical protein